MFNTIESLSLANEVCTNYCLQFVIALPSHLLLSLPEWRQNGETDLGFKLRVGMEVSGWQIDNAVVIYIWVKGSAPYQLIIVLKICCIVKTLCDCLKPFHVCEFSNLLFISGVNVPSFFPKQSFWGPGSVLEGWNALILLCHYES